MHEHQPVPDEEWNKFSAANEAGIEAERTNIRAEEQTSPNRFKDPAVRNGCSVFRVNVGGTFVAHFPGESLSYLPLLLGEFCAHVLRNSAPEAVYPSAHSSNQSVSIESVEVYVNSPVSLAIGTR